MRRAAIVVIVVLIVAVAWWWRPELAGHTTPSHSGAEQAGRAKTFVPKAFDPGSATRPPVMRGISNRDPNTPFQPMPPQGAALRDVLPALKQQAAQGDAVAACRIAFELNRCAKLDWMRFAASHVNQRDPGQSTPQTLSTIVLGQLKDGEKACAGLPDEELEWTFDYALAAALAGNRESRYELVRAYNVGLDWFRPDRTLEAWAQWRQHVGAVINAGIDDGDPRVFAQGTWAYLNADHGHRVFPKDPVRALALRMALADASSPDKRKVNEREAQYTIESEVLGAGDVARARAMASTLAVKPRGYDSTVPRSPFGNPKDCESP